MKGKEITLWRDSPPTSINSNLCLKYDRGGFGSSQRSSNTLFAITSKTEGFEAQAYQKRDQYQEGTWKFDPGGSSLNWWCNMKKIKLKEKVNLKRGSKASKSVINKIGRDPIELKDALYVPYLQKNL